MDPPGGLGVMTATGFGSLQGLRVPSEQMNGYHWGLDHGRVRGRWNLPLLAYTMPRGTQVVVFSIWVAIVPII